MTALDHMIESDARDMVPRASWRETAAALVSLVVSGAFFVYALLQAVGS